MKQKQLLNLGMMLAAGLGAQAQNTVFHEGFDAAQTKSPSDVAYYEYINSIANGNGEDERSIDNDNAAEGAGCLSFYNVGPYADADADTTDVSKHNNWWMRAVKFRNLPLQEGKSYRLSFRFKGSNTWSDGSAENKCKMSVALMQGGENKDIALLDPKGKEFRYEVSYFNPEDYEKYTRMFFFASADLQKNTYAEKNPDKEPLEDKFFATFNIFNPGQFFLDEVDLVESSVEAVQYEADVVRVNFGYGTNIKDLVAASPIGRVLMPTDCATVKVNGNDAKVVGVELHNDGYMYIYLDEDNAAEDNEAKVEVAFNNPTDPQYQLLYKGDLAPEGAVMNFEGETGTYLEDLSTNLSYEYTQPELAKATPEDGSFNLDETTSEVSFTFDKKVLTTDESGQPLSCVLDNGEELELVTKPEIVDGEEVGSETLTFARKGGKTFTKGTYSVTLSGVCSAKGIANYGTFTTTFETGKIAIAKETITPVQTINFTNDAPNTIPAGWTVNNEGEIRPGGSSQGGGPRVFAFADGGDVKNALYLRAKNNDNGEPNPGYAETEETVTLPAGDLRIQFLGFCWKGASLKVDAEVLDAAGENVVAHQEGTLEAGANGATSYIPTSDKITVAMKNEAEGAYKLRFRIIPTSGNWSEIMFGGVVVNTYSKTEGESTEAEVAFEDKAYGGANGVAAADNCAPKEGSGWELWQDGAMRNPGQDYNYNGTRLFALTIKNMSMGYYTNGNWPNNYVVYGNASADGEPKLHLKAGRNQITYYVANWKEKGANAGKDHIAYFELANKETGELLYERNDKIVDCDMDGNRAANVAAKQIQFVVNIPEEGDYTIKLGGTTEMFIGNYKIEKLGSQTAYYIGIINNARDLAIEEYKACEDAKYDGATKTALKAVIDKYEDPTFVHTPAEVNNAKAEIDNATKAMSIRREYISRYDQAMTNAGTILAEVGETEEHAATKYAKLEAYTNLNETFGKFYGKSASELEDADLLAATTSLEDNYTWLKNMKDKAIGLLTKQVVDAAAVLVNLDESMSTNEQVIAAGNALTDDQDLANLLQMRITKAIYDKLAEGEDLFTEFDVATEEEVKKTIDLSSFIQNANLYVTETNPNRLLNDNANLPGWNVERISGTPNVEVGWNTFNGSNLNPVNDQNLIAGWYTEWKLSQTVKNLPVGKYSYVSSTQDRGFGDNSDDKKAQLDQREHWTVEGNINGTEGNAGEIFSYIYWTVGDQTGKKPYNITNQGQWYGFSDCTSDDFNIPAGENGTGEVTIGSHAISYQAQAAADNFRIFMIDKDPNFDYATASKKLAEKIDATGVNKVNAPEGEPVKVTYYDLNGAMTTTPSGIAIKVVTYANGYMEVKKVMIK